MLNIQVILAAYKVRDQGIDQSLFIERNKCPETRLLRLCTRPGIIRDLIYIPCTVFQSGFNFGVGAGGMPGIGSMLNNPAMMQMAQQMMSNPDMQNMYVYNNYHSF